MKLECQLSSTSSLHQELEESRSQFERQLATAEKRLSEVHSRKMSELNSCNDDLKSEMEKLNVSLDKLAYWVLVQNQPSSQWISWIYQWEYPLD